MMKNRSKEQLLVEARIMSGVYKDLSNYILDTICNNISNMDSTFMDTVIKLSLDTFLLSIVDYRINLRRFTLDSVKSYINSLGVPSSCYNIFKDKVKIYVDKYMSVFDGLLDDDIYCLIDMYILTNKEGIFLFKDAEDTKFSRYALRKIKEMNCILNFGVDSILKDCNTIEDSQVSLQKNLTYISDHKRLNNLATDNNF